jgi:hypothetical protein
VNLAGEKERQQGSQAIAKSYEKGNFHGDG